MTRQIRCQRARDLLPAYLDGALTLGDREQLEAHLSSCALCAEELRSSERLDVRTRVALRSVVEEYSLSPQREAQIRSRLLAAASESQRRRWPRLNMSSLVAGLAAVILVLSAGIATLRPTPPPSEQRGFVSYASGPTDRDLLFSEGGRSALRAAPVTITFLDSTLPESVYAPLVESFQVANPDVTIEVRRPDLADPGFLADEGDCFVASADITSPDVRQRLRPITRFAQADAQIRTDDFFPPLLDLVRADDQLYGLPRTAQLRLLFFDNRTLIENGATPPSADWTSDDLAATAAHLRARLPAGSYPYLPYDGYDAAYLLAQRGTRAPHAGDVRLDTGTTAAAVDWYAQLIGPAALALNDPQSVAQRQRLVASDQVAIWAGPPVARHKLAPSIGIVPLPADPGRPGALQADAYFISKDTSGSRAGACWRWVRYLSFQTFAWERVPARSSQVAAHSFLQQFGQRQTGVVVAALSRSAPIDAWTPTTVAALSDAIDDVALRAVPARSALLRVQRYLDSEWQ